MSNQIVSHFEGELRVSSETITDRVGGEHRAVLQLISTHQERLERFGTLAFEMRPLPGGGNPVRVAYLNEQQGTLLMTFMKNTERVVDFKVELVDQFYKMRQALTMHQLPQSFAEALALAASQAKQMEALEAKQAVDAPKVEYVDTFVADGDLRLLRNVAKSIGMTESELRTDLIERKWLYSEHATRWSESKQEKETVFRYSAYSHKSDYFTPVPNHQSPRFKGELMHTLKVTPLGATAIARLHGRHLKAVEAVGA